MSWVVSSLVEGLVAHGAMLALGATLILALGCIAGATLARRSPVHRLRLAEATVAGTLAWMTLALLPLPRPSRDAPAVHLPSPPVPAALPWAAPSPAAPLTPDELAEALREVQAVPADRGTGASPVLVAGNTGEAPVPQGPPERLQRVPGPWVLARVYLAGLAAGAAWLLLGRCALIALVGRCAPAPPDALRLLASLGHGRRPPRLLVSPRASRPITFGLLRPTIVVPAALLAPQLHRRLRQVLLHELAHVAHRDAWGAALMNLALPPLWAHPLYWLLRRRAAADRELLADDLASRADGKDAYAAELLELARACSRATGTFPAAATVALVAAVGVATSAALSPGLPLFRRTSAFYRRMRMLLERDGHLEMRWTGRSRLTLAAAWLAAVGGLGLLIGVRPAGAQPGARPGAHAEPGGAPTAPAADEGVEPGAPGAPPAPGAPAAPPGPGDDPDVPTVPDLPGAPAGPPPVSDPQREIQRLRLEVRMLQAALSEAHAARAAQEARAARADREARDARAARDPNAVPGASNRMSPGAPTAPGTLLGPAPSAGHAGGPMPPPGSSSVALPGVGRDAGPGAVPGAVPGAGPAAPAALPAAGVHLDLVNLANSGLDAVSALQLAQIRLKQAERMVAERAVPQLDLETAAAQCRAAERRVALFRGLTKVALESASEDLALTKQLVEAGRAPTGRLAEGRAKVEMLKLILASLEG